MITTTSIGEVTDKVEFPCIARFSNNENQDFLVLFTEEKVGTVIHSNNPNIKLGEYFDDWIPVFKSDWEILESVEITFKY